MLPTSEGLYPPLTSVNWHGDFRTWFRVRVVDRAKFGGAGGDSYARRWGSGYLVYLGGALVACSREHAINWLMSERDKNGGLIYAGHEGWEHSQICQRKYRISSG